jgi:hypothetical protein
MNKEKTGSLLLDWGFVLFACSLPWSNFGMSISYFVMLGGLILLPCKKPTLDLKSVTPGISLAGVFLIFLIPILYTNNLQEALHDLNIKMPCLLVGLILLFKKSYLPRLSSYKKYVRLFSISCFLSILFSLCYYIYLCDKGIFDSRKASPFISHIRLSLMGAISVLFFIEKYFELQGKKILYLLASLVLSAAVVYLGWVNGIFAIFIGIVVLIGFRLFPLSKKKIIYLGATLMAISALGANEYSRLGPLFRKGKIPFPLVKETINHRKYFHDTLLVFSENGFRYGLYYQPDEFKSAWEKRSKKTLDQYDAKGNQIKFTCFRYLTSKGLTKDSLGVWQLTAADIDNIENGIPNYRLVHLIPIEKRLYEFFVEWQAAESSLAADGHSLGMRTIYWKTGINLIKENFLFGVGTGNIPNTIKEYYEKRQNQLEPEFRKRSHNQYITTFLNSGIFGFLFFLLFLLLPIAVIKPPSSYLMASWLILVFSMFSEDTLETQAGVGIFIWIIIQGSFHQPNSKVLRRVEDKPQPHASN